MHRLFHSLVVCGAGLTVVHCGGKSRDRDDSGAARGGTQAASGSSAGGSSASAGASGSGKGGSGKGGSGNGGGGSDSGAAGEPSTGAHPDGPTEQWVCDTWRSSCTEPGDPGVNLDPATCVAEPERPQTESDCEPGTLLACFAGSLNGEEVRFNCECGPAPPPMEPWLCPCPELENPGTCPFDPAPTSCEQSSLCACAITCILK